MKKKININLDIELDIPESETANYSELAVALVKSCMDNIYVVDNENTYIYNLLCKNNIRPGLFKYNFNINNISNNETNKHNINITRSSGINGIWANSKTKLL